MDNSTNALQEDRKINDGRAAWWLLVLPPVLIIFGTIGNILSIIVLSRKRMYKSISSSYLIALAVADIANLNTGALPIYLNYVARVKELLINSVYCRTTTMLSYASPYSSAWIQATITLDRIFAIFFPHRYRSVCTRKRVICTLSAIVGTIFAINVHFLIGFDIKQVPIGDGAYAVDCEPNGAVYLSFVQHVWPIVDFVLYSLIPFVVMAIGGCAIFYKFSIQKTLIHVPGTQVSGYFSRSGLSKLTIILAIVYIVCTAPFSVYIIMTNVVYGDAGQLQPHEDPLFGSCYLLWMVNSAVNFLLYFFTGSRFRVELRNLFIKTRVTPLPSTTTNRVTKF